jgi:hypothetical protein
MKRKTVLVFLLTLGLALVPIAVRGEGAPPGLTGGSLESSNASFDGQAAGNEAGTSVAIAGDVNGDGYADLVIGAPYYDDGGNPNAGRVYIFLGGPGGWRLDEGLASADATYTGASGDEAGTSVAGAGDVNGDGYPDLIVGSPGHSSLDPSTYDDGRAILIYGRASMSGALSADGTLSSGVTSDSRLGASVSGVGDANGDGYDDVLIGSPGYNSGAGEATLWMGATSAASMSIADYDGAAGDEAGTSVAGAGDVNGDGYPDLLVGLPGYSSSTGRGVLIYGSASIPGTLTANGTLSGGVGGNRLGESVSGVGDVNGDGYDDMLLGSPGYGSDQGEVTLWTGAPVATRMSIISYAGETTGDQAGGSVGGAGDVNGDGYADVLIGASGYNSSAGRAYLVLGSGAPSDSGLSSADVLYTGVFGSDQAGASVSGAGDVNGDGYSDFVVGAPGFGSSQGKAYLLFSDHSSSPAARYRDMINSSAAISTTVGFSGVTAQYTAGAPGSVYVTKHYRSTCGTDFATNGMLWTVDSQRGGSAQATFAFEYNDTQVAGMTEGDLKLYYRDRPCQDWTQDSTAALDTTHNRITSSSVTDAHREYTIAASQPSATALGPTSVGVAMAKEPPWLVVGGVVLVVLTVAAKWWERRLDRRGMPRT